MSQSLALYGRPKIDGEFKICSMEKKSKQDRYGFLFDKALLVCKKRSGENLELKELIELQHFQLRDEPSGEKDSKKWTHTFLLMDLYGQGGYDLYFKTRELKKKWLEQFEMALSNMCPENGTANGHDFQMHCFEDTTSCKACQMLLRGIFYQGYRCSRCKMAAHKECLGRVPACGRNSEMSGTLKKHVLLFYIEHYTYVDTQAHDKPICTL
ncbi:proto-oncogene vav-like protein [Labeo rohita]|uniref:Proto-oncogene vav-like protein n=1 Tax=Labeo rohita TaxID=84645 RepID=A0A498P3N9_LABRO|nr:proto-oncogene vav-like protein [Labeo rohita]